MIPEPYNSKPLGTEPLIALMIIIVLPAMLSAIQINDQSLLKANKINNIVSDGRLPAKLAAAQLAASDLPPENSLGIC